VDDGGGYGDQDASQGADQATQAAHFDLKDTDSEGEEQMGGVDFTK
jgi:hypothetical protein